MTLDNMTGITKGSYTGVDLFCKSQLITCKRVKECNGVADKEMNEQTVIDHDKEWIIGCIKHDDFIHTHRFDKANQIILDALEAFPDRPTGEWINHFYDLFPEDSTIECSICHEHQPVGINENYCPNCGAKMEEMNE